LMRYKSYNDANLFCFLNFRLYIIPETAVLTQLPIGYLTIQN
jgi:hypothetical protein